MALIAWWEILTLKIQELATDLLPVLVYVFLLLCISESRDEEERLLGTRVGDIGTRVIECHRCLLFYGLVLSHVP